MKMGYTLSFTDLLLFEVKNTHLYSHSTRASRSIRVWVATLWGQQPVVRSKREEDEHSCQRPKEPRKKQCNTKLHDPGLSSRLATGCPHSVWLSPPTTASACDKLRQKQSLLLRWSTITEWDGLLFCPAGLCWVTGLDSSPVPLSVLCEDKVVHMTPLDPAGVRNPPTTTTL